MSRPMSLVGNRDSPNPSLASECAPPPRTGGRGAHSPAGEGLGESQFRQLEKKLSTLPALWFRLYRPTYSHMEGGELNWREGRRAIVHKAGSKYQHD
jgi:hypothetical protein